MSPISFEAFDKYSKKQWKQILQYELKGAPYEDLIWKTLEGINVNPIYTSEKRPQNPIHDSDNSSFIISERFKASNDLVALKKSLNHSKSCGSDKARINLSASFHSFKELSKLLKGSKEIVLHAEELTLTNLKKLIASTPKEDGHQIIIDPIGFLESTGNHMEGFSWEELLELVKEHKTLLKIGLDASLYQESGASCIQQLTFAISKAKEYLERLSYSPLLRFELKLALGTNFFFEIGKIKSSIILWDEFCKQLSLANSLEIFVCSSQRTFSIYDYNSNILRASISNMAGVIAGSLEIEQIAYDTIFKEKNRFSEDIARSQLLVLRNESHLSGVNWVKGSYYLENLITTFVKKSIEELKKLEVEGGYLKALYQNNIQEKIMLQHAKEFNDFQQGTTSIVGLNLHKNSEEKMKENIEIKTDSTNLITSIQPIRRMRIGQVLESQLLEQE
jgi:methylmalonyl-CoA mutase